MFNGGNETPDLAAMIRHLLRMQIAVIVGVSALAWLHSREAALAAALGGGIAALVNLYATRRVFGTAASIEVATAGAEAVEVGRLYRAEIGKLVMAVVLFTTLFVLVDELNVVAILAGYAGVHLSGVVATMRPTRG